MAASEGRPTLQTIGEEEEYRIRSNQGHTGDTELASLGQALGCIEAWMLHATSLSLLPSIWKQGLLPHGAPTQRGRAPRQDLYFGLGTDPRARFPNLRTHPCSKLTNGRNVMIWISWGPGDPAGAQTLMRVTETGAILTRILVSRAHLYLAVLFAPDTVSMVVVAASRQACTARADIMESFSAWGVLRWADDPAEYWTNDANPVDEPTVSPDIPADVLGPDWPTPLTEADLHWSEADGDPAGENPEGGSDWTHHVDLDSTEGNDVEEDALDPPNPPLSPIDEGTPPGDEDSPPPIDQEDDRDDGDDGEGKGGGSVSVAERVARALAHRPAPPPTKHSAPPLREGSRPPLEPPNPQQGGSRHREAPPSPWAATQAPGRNPRGNGDAQWARMGLSSSSASGGPNAPPAYPAVGPSDDEVRARLAPATMRSELVWPRPSASRKKLA